MSRVLIALAVAAATLAATACADNILKERPVRHVAGTPPASLSAVHTGESSVCSAYRRQLRHVQVALDIQALAGKREQLRARALTLNAIIADACE
jgi:hypothetical protein